MKVEIKKIDATKRELRFEVPQERVTQKLDEVYNEIGKQAEVKGFRAGKAPRHVLEAHYGKLAQDEMIKKLIPEVYQETIVKEQLNPIDLPEIENVSFKDGTVSFTAKLDIKPEVIIKEVMPEEAAAAPAGTPGAKPAAGGAPAAEKKAEVPKAEKK